MAVSVVRKLERCERIGRASSPGEAMLHAGENYQVIKYKIKIKDCFSSKLNDRVMKGSLNYAAPNSNEDIMSENVPVCRRLQNLHAQAACKGSSPSPPWELHADSLQGAPPLPCLLHQIHLHQQAGASQQNLHEEEELHYEEDDSSFWLQHPWKLQDYVLQHESVSSNTSSSQDSPPNPLTHIVNQDNEEAFYSRSPWKLQLESSNFERDEEINCAPSCSSPYLKQTVKESEEEPSSPRKLQKGTEDEMEQLGSGKDGREGERPPWKLKKDVQEKAGEGMWEAVKKMECECCGMEEECTGGYEQKVRAGLRGHWLCGLCEEAVGEERKRVGGSVQAALVAHMQPCRRFSRRARSKASPPPSDVAVPHAVCRLLCRHLSTPSPRSHSSPCASLSRSSSCVPSLPI